MKVLEWLWFGFFLSLGSGAVGYLTGRATRLFELFRDEPGPAMFPFYIAIFAVFLSKGMLSEPLVSLHQDADLAHAFPWSPGYGENLPGTGPIALDAALLTIAVGGPALEMNRQWMVRLRWDVKGIQIPLGKAMAIQILRWLPVMMMTTVGFWTHVMVTHQHIAVASAVLGLGIISIDLAIRGGLKRAMTTYLDRRQQLIDSLTATREGVPSRSRLAHGLKWMLWTRWALLLLVAGAVGQLAVMAETAAQMIPNTGPIVFMLMAGTALEAIKSALVNRADADLDRAYH